MGAADSQKLLPWRGRSHPLRGANLRLTAKSTLSEMFGILDPGALVAFHRRSLAPLPIARVSFA